MYSLSYGRYKSIQTIVIEISNEPKNIFQDSYSKYIFWQEFKMLCNLNNYANVVYCLYRHCKIDVWIVNNAHPQNNNCCFVDMLIHFQLLFDHYLNGGNKIKFLQMSKTSHIIINVRTLREKLLEFSWKSKKGRQF